MRISKTLAPVEQYAAEHGWSVRRFTKKNTVIYWKEGCELISVSLCPRDRRAVDNMLSKMRIEDRALAEKKGNNTH